MDEASNAKVGKQRLSAGLASVEGYTALALLPFLLLGPRLPGYYGLVVGIPIWGCSWLFAISGIRRGRRGARIAAGIALALLVLQAGISLLVLYN